MIAVVGFKMMKRFANIIACLLLVGCSRTTDGVMRIVKRSDSEDGTAQFYIEQAHLIDSLMQMNLQKRSIHTNTVEIYVGNFGQVTNILLTTYIREYSPSKESVFAVTVSGQYPNTKSARAQWNQFVTLVRRNSDITKWTKPNHGLESTSAPPAAGTLETHP